jgi:hypothetical protein
MLVLVTIVGMAIAGIAGGTASSPAKPVSLTITYWADEQAPGTFERWTLRCRPAAGTLRDPRRACTKLSNLSLGAFAPVPPEALCGLVYGGPQKAVVKGTIRGARIWASFRRRNLCEISRWERFSPWLLPAG